MTDSQRAEIERAASLQGSSLTQWALDRLLQAARDVIRQETVTRVSSEAFDVFSAALDQGMPPEAEKLLESRPLWE